jgi:hypothetical protein
MKQSIYGIKTIIINETVLHTFKIRVVNNYHNFELLCNSSLNIKTSPKMIYITETTVDRDYFNVKTSELGICLKQIAQNNLNEKYGWVK